MNDDEDNEFEEVETGFRPLSEEETNLLYPPEEIGIRCFKFNHIPTSFFGVLIEESDDSFLVALPAYLVAENNKTYLQSPVSEETSVIRLLKSTVFMVTIPKGIPLENYHVFLKEVSPKLYPGLLSELGIESERETEETCSEVEEKLEKAILNGGFITNVGKSIH